MRRAGNDALAGADDAAVIEGSWQEPERFAVVFDRHAPHIHRYLARRVGRQIADDLVAETFLAAFGKRHQYDLSYSGATPWLYGIATNLVGQHRRDDAPVPDQAGRRPGPGHARSRRAGGRQRDRAGNTQAAGRGAGRAISSRSGRACPDRLRAAHLRQGGPRDRRPGGHYPVAAQPGPHQGTPDSRRHRCGRRLRGDHDQ